MGRCNQLLVVGCILYWCGSSEEVGSVLNVVVVGSADCGYCIGWFAQFGVEAWWCGCRQSWQIAKWGSEEEPVVGSWVHLGMCGMFIG